jgi:hypothetical protein
MNQKSMTPDERFLLQLYQTALSNGDPLQEMDSRVIAKAVGLKETALKNIVKHLAQANFIKKSDSFMLYLTPHGCQFIREHLNGDSLKKK